MSELAIRVHSIGKQYRIGQRERYYTFRDTLMNTLRAPFHTFRVDGSQPSSVSNSQFAMRNPQLLLPPLADGVILN